MTKLQKIIKYFAIGLAISLIVSIFSLFVSIISNIFGFKTSDKIDEVVIKEIKSDILEMDIEIDNAKLTFKTDNVFKIEANNNIRIKENNKKLVIKEKSSLFNDNLDDIFEKHIAIRGKDYYTGGSVKFLEKVEDKYYAVVEGTQKYLVIVWYDDKKKKMFNVFATSYY